MWSHGYSTCHWEPGNLHLVPTAAERWWGLMWLRLSSEHQFPFMQWKEMQRKFLFLQCPGVPGQEGSAEEDIAQGDFPPSASGRFCVMDAEARTDAVRRARLNCYSEICKLSSSLCEQHGEKMTCCCEILVRELRALLCPAARALTLGRVAQSPPDPTASEGSRDLSHHQYKTKTCLQCEPLQHPALLPE